MSAGARVRSAERLVIVALGSNLGDSPRTILTAMDRLQAFSAEPMLRSSLWRSAPVDCPPEAPDFINAVVGFEPLPAGTPETLLDKLQVWEREFGRQPKRMHNESRPLDLDLIAFGDETRCTERLTLPHPRAHLRQFVLAPLAEILPDFVLPGQTVAVAQLLRGLPSASTTKL